MAAVAQQCGPLEQTIGKVELPSSIEHAIRSSTGLRALGYLDAQGFFHRESLPALAGDAIVLDTSNIAWFGRSRQDGEQALVSNIETVLDHLKDRGFKRVYAFADAALRHQVDDPRTLEGLLADRRIELVPRRCPR